MNNFDRLTDVISGRTPDRIPVSFWRHFPLDDRDPDRLAEAHVAFLRRYEFDFLKVTPRAGYAEEGWGWKPGEGYDEFGVAPQAEAGLKEPAGWLRLRTLDPGGGALGEGLRCLARIARELRDAFPVFQTIFSPLTIANKLSGGLVAQHLRERPDWAKPGLEAIAETMARYAVECLKHGAHGIFYATQMATTAAITPGEHKRYGEPMDLMILEELTGRAQYIILHIHGTDIMFRELLDYPVHMVNWHDTRTFPSLSEARRLTSRTLIGGINELELPRLTRDEVRSEVRKAVADAGPGSLIIGAGCVLPLKTSDELIQAAVDEARSAR